MKMNYFYRALVALLLTTTACNTQNNKDVITTEKSNIVAEQCVVLHDSAMSLLNKYYFEDTNPTKLDLILDLLNQAIACDTNYFLAYNDKVTVLSIKGEYMKVVSLLNKMLEFSGNDPQLIFLKGIAYEKLNNYSAAETAYKKAAIEYEKRLNLYPDSIEMILDKLFFIAFTKGKGEALSELNKYILKYPDNTMFQDYKPMFENFNRDDFMIQHEK